MDSFPAMSDDLKARLRDDLIVVRKARNRLGTVVLTTLLSEVRNREIEVGEELDDEGIQAVVAKAVKQRRDAADLMLEAGRPELAGRNPRRPPYFRCTYHPLSPSPAYASWFVKRSMPAPPKWVP